MKKLLAIILLLTLLLTACAKEEPIVVDSVNHTITQGKTTYEYTDTTEGDTRTIVILYPEGGRYTWVETGNISHGSMGGVVGSASGRNGPDLVNAILNPNQPEENIDSRLQWFIIVAGILVAGYGLWQVCCPYAVWNIFMRWYYKEEPGEYALTRIISSGIAEIILGIAMILIAIFA